jgi:hypothetical protein
MLVTEDQACNMICHKTMVYGIAGAMACIGRKCMAWRSSGLLDENNNLLCFCGVAGKPIEME